MKLEGLRRQLDLERLEERGEPLRIFLHARLARAGSGAVIVRCGRSLALGRTRS